MTTKGINHFDQNTKLHMREAWQPAVIDRTPWDEWVKKGRPSVNDIARQKARQILATHEPEPLPCADRVREIIRAYERA